MKIKLFCIAYAGGSAAAYSLWNKCLSSDIELIPIELAGRGKRASESFYKTLEEAADDVYSILIKNIEGSDYALYGHSMGSWIAFEVLERLKRNHDKQPVTVFFSANTPPHLEPDEEKISDLNDDDFSNRIIAMGDTPKEILTGDMRNFFLPILRADYNLVETYIHRNRNISFDCDIHVLYGKRDHIDKNSLIEWKKYTNKDFHIKGFDGGHMFFRDNFYETTDYINQTVAHIS